MTISEKLQKLYPTPESLIKAKKDYPSWVVMAKAVNVSVSALFDHRKALGMEMPVGNKKQTKKAEQLTDAQIKENIRNMFASESKNIVTTYKITDKEEFLKNPCGNDGIKLVGVEQGGIWNHEHNPGVRR